MESLSSKKSRSNSRSKSRSNSQSKTKKLVIDNEDTSKSIISKFVKKYLEIKREKMKQIDIDKMVKKNAVKIIQMSTKKMLTRKREKAATLIQKSIKAKQVLNMKKQSRDLGLQIGNILCNNTIKNVTNELKSIINFTDNETKVETIKDLRLLNCTLGKFKFSDLTNTIEDSTIFNVSFASTNFKGIRFSNVVFLSGNDKSEAYKVYTKYYGLEDTDRYSTKIGKKLEFILKFTKSILINCIFENCTFYNISFSECKLSGCIFKNCKFISCSFKNTIFDEIEVDTVSKGKLLKGVYFNNCSIIFKNDSEYTGFINHNTTIDFSQTTMMSRLYTFKDCLFTNNSDKYINIFNFVSSPGRESIINYTYFIDCSIKQCDFSKHIILNNNINNFHKCSIKDSRFIGCQINYNTFSNCDFNECNFQRSILHISKDSKYENNKFIKCNFILIKLGYLSREKPQEPFKFVFENIDFTKSCFSCTNLINVNFRRCNMQGCDFSPRVFTDGTIRNTIFNSVKFEDSIIKTCNFQQVEGLTRYDFTKVANRDLTSVNFTAVELEGSNFERCKLTGTIFQLATLNECNFRDVHTFQNADFTNIVGVPDNIPEGLNIDGTIQAANETHNRFSFIKNNADKIIINFNNYYKEDSQLLIIDETQYSKLENVRLQLLEIEKSNEVFYNKYKIDEDPYIFISMFINLYTDVLSKEELNTLSRNLSKCINTEFIEKINSNSTMCNLIMHSIWFLTHQCKFYKKKFIDLYIDDIFNAHGKDSASCLLGMIERLVSVHSQVIETMKATLEPYKTIEELKGNGELYKLFDDIPDKLYSIYIEKTIYLFNKILNLMIPNTFLSESIEEENIFSDIVLDLEFTKIREEWYSKMKQYYNLYIKYNNGEDIGINKELIEKIVEDNIFTDINRLLIYYKDYIKTQDKITSVFDKLKKIQSEYTSEFVKDKCSIFIKTIDDAINKEVKTMNEAIFGIALKNPETDSLTPEEIGEYLEGGSRSKITSRRQNKSKDYKKLEEEIISIFFKHNNVLEKDEGKEIPNDIPLELNKHLKEILQDRREKYYINRYHVS